MPELISPTTRLHAAWLEASPFARRSDTSRPPDPGFVHASYWWIVEGDTYPGRSRFGTS